MSRRHPLPAEVIALVERTPAAILLESARPGSCDSLSLLFLSPVRVLQANNPAEIPGLFAQIEAAIASNYIAAGFFTYECGAAFAAKAVVHSRNEPSSSVAATPPLAWFGIFEQNYTYDHLAGFFRGGDPPDLADLQLNRKDQQPEPARPIELTHAITREVFAHKIEAIHEWIRSGDVYQLNFTFPMRTRIASRPAALYAHLRKQQPVDYCAFLHWQQGRYILSFSPELFFRLEDDGTARRITTRPMKGTARRGRTTVEDHQIAEYLHNDIKNRSENVMIVDLLRNDLGKICEFGSVRVESLFAVERYPTLWQMTSTVSGILRPDVGNYDIFSALFPCGSITGAPKLRSMQLLAQMEAEPRGVYTGAVGYFSREKTVFNVAIRTLEVSEQNVKMGVGSGIVIDSKADDEYHECQLKAEFLTRSEAPFSIIETMLWQAGFPLLELHLDRLCDSACYFDFPCDRAEVRASLLDIAGTFPNPQPRKVRLLLDADGRLSIENALLLPEATAAVNRVCIAPQHTDSGDRFLFHKTTNRPLYAASFKAAQDAGFCDVLFLNEQGQVTEGAISNIFVSKGGCLLTPPISCGLLPGVYRRHLLATRSDVEERILRLDDLQTADAVFLSNAMRGLRRVSMDLNSR
jgi:para-aminobenzoate synthetase / 4-amino-4-deoxychorismate lyase